MTQLTPTDLEILSLCADGYTSQEIAHKTHRAVSTVKSNKSRIIRKLGARNIAEAVYMSVAEIARYRESSGT